MLPLIFHFIPSIESFPYDSTFKCAYVLIFTFGSRFKRNIPNDSSLESNEIITKVIGITIGSMLTGVTAYAASGTPIKALLQKVNIYVDGTKKSTTNAITYNNTTYVPVRSISSALGENVALKSNNVYIGKQPQIKLTGDQAFELLYKKIKKEIEMYSLTVGEEPKDGDYYVMRSYSDRETHEITYGLYYIHMYTGEVYEWNFKSKKMVKL